LASGLEMYSLTAGPPRGGLFPIDGVAALNAIAVAMANATECFRQNVRMSLSIVRPSRTGEAAEGL